MPCSWPAQHSVPVIPFGVGSSLEGHLLAVQGGISIDVARMNKVLSVNAEDLTVTVQPGVTRKQLNEEIKSTGLFFPIDPGADASHRRHERHARQRHQRRALRHDARERAGARSGHGQRRGDPHRHARQEVHRAGYDLTRLIVGSEGTLGVITEVTLQLYPLPEAISAAICSFPSIEAAVRTTIQIIQLGVPIARVRADRRQHRAHGQRAQQAGAARRADAADGVPRLAGRREGAGRDGAGDRGRARRQRLRMGHARRKSARACGPRGTTPTSRPSSHARLPRRSPPTPACRSRAWPTACSTRWRKPTPAASPTSWSATSATATSTSATCSTPTSPRSARPPRSSTTQLVARALRLEGTCTGEHGVGLHKMGFLVDEAGAGAVDMMRTIKRALDPKNIMNPGKIFSL